MLRTALKNLLAHRMRLLGTVLAVTLGVSFMAGTLVLTDTMTSTFNNLFATVYQGTDAVVRSKAVFEGPQGMGQQRARIDASLLPQLRNVPGVAAAEGTIFGYARITGSDGQALGNPSNGAPTLGGNWSDNKELNSFTLVEGRPPRADNEVVIDKKSATDGHLAVGQHTTILTQGPPQSMLITGIVRFGDVDSPGGASVAMFTTPAAQKLVAEPGKFDAISFVAKPGVSQEQLVANLRPHVPAGLEAVTGAKLISEAQNQVQKSMGFFNTFLLVFAVVALLVGAFMIFNTFSITVAQRTRENGLFRALGASRRQVLSSVLLEALVIGLLASVLGLVLGVAVAAGLKSFIHAIGIEIPAGSLVFAARTVIISLVAGTGITLLAALSPARKAGKVSPVAAMQDAVVTSTGYGSRQRIYVGAGILTLGVVAVIAGLFAKVSSPMAIVGLGALLLFFGVSTLGRTVSLPLSRVLAAPLPRLRGIAGTLARQNAMRNPKRTAATASALMVCVALVGFITIFASSAKSSINTVVDQAFTGDFIINSGGGMMGGVDPTLAQRLNNLPQIADASGLRLGLVDVYGKVTTIGAVDARTAFKIFDVQPLQGSPANLGATSIAVFKKVADDHNLKLGSTVWVTYKDTGRKPMTVALIYNQNRPAGDYLLGIDAYKANFASQYDSYVFIKKAPGVSSAAALAAVNSVARDYPGAKVLDQTQFKADTAKPLNQLLGLVYV
ncbi:MAG TPA: ABC transporter permease, partial [Acidimicrobiales bacterium]|nr:ABC transporter permease [Acidimicrobiales bacterium]